MFLVTCANIKIPEQFADGYEGGSVLGAYQTNLEMCTLKITIVHSNRNIEVRTLYLSVESRVNIKQRGTGG